MRSHYLSVSIFVGAMVCFSPFAKAAPVSPALVTQQLSEKAAQSSSLHRTQYSRGWGRGHNSRGWGRGHNSRGWGRGHRHYGRGPGYRRGWGPGLAAGLIIGGSIASSRRGSNDGWQRCDDAYRSFRWEDGTFQPYGGGPRRLCPYL
jgi:hypothetical protein